MKKNRIALQLACCGLILGAQAMMGASISTTGLSDWCVNLNGDTNTACNGGTGGTGGLGLGGPSGNGSIDLSAFDTTLRPGTNSLGTVTVTLGAGSNQNVDFWADYDLDAATYGAFQDSGAVSGALPTGVSYELDDPNTSNIFGDFAANTLGNFNNVGTYAGPPSECCDVSFALGFSGINVAAGGSGTVTFDVSTVAPSSGFYITQTNGPVGDSIYLQGSVNVVAPSTPEPSTFGLGLLAAAGLMAFARHRRRASLIAR